MHQRYEIELLADGVVKSDLLVPAIALIHRVGQNRDGKPGVLKLPGSLEGAVIGGVVDDQDLGVVFGERRRHALEHRLDGPLRVVGDDKYQQSLGRRHGIILP